jgi:hypothetical protein
MWIRVQRLAGGRLELKSLSENRNQKAVTRQVMYRLESRQLFLVKFGCLSQIVVFWVVTPRIPAHGYRRFRGKCSHILG